MEIIPVGLKRARLGLPFYAAWNFAAYIQREQGAAAKVRMALGAVPTIAIILTVLWAAPWLALWRWIVRPLISSE
jgi:hypothetical protein